jgi:hypothetical protein
VYTLNTTATGVPKGLNKRWQPVDLTTPTVQELFQDYRVLQITLTPEDAIEPVYLMLHDLNDEFLSYTHTVQAMLDAYYTEAALPTVDTPVVIDKAIARFYDAFKLRYQVKLVDDANIEPPAVYDATDYDHVRLEREDIVMNSTDAVSNVLANINGFYHLAQDIGSRGIFVRDAMKSLRLSGQNQVGLWDFRPLGGFSVLPTVPGVVDGSTFQVNLPNDVSSKTVFFVIAGYFFPVDGTVVSQNGTRNFSIDFQHASMRLAARYFEAANYIDLSAIATIAAGTTAGSIDVTKLYNAAAIAAWMALSQTFVVVVNRKSCYVQSRYVQRTGNPNQYLCYLDRDFSPTLPTQVGDARMTLRPTDLPLALELGRHPPYWCVTDRWIHTLSIYNNRVGELLYETGQPAEGVVTSGADQPGSPGLVQHAYLLEFGSDVQDA